MTTNKEQTAPAEQQDPQVTLPKDEQGNELRDRTWRLIYSAGAEYAPKYISLRDEFTNVAAPIDGLIRTPRGYYRLAEDTRSGKRILLHSYERDQLTGVEQDGTIILGEDATDVYGVSAREDVRGAIFRDDMQHDMRYLEHIFQKDLNLHAQELTIPAENPDLPPRRKVKLANGLVAFGIVQTDDDKWRIRVYKNLRKDWDETASFAKVSTDADHSKLFNPMRMIRDKEGNVKEFDQLEDALHFARELWKVESRLLFQGKPLMEEKKNALSFTERMRLRATRFALKINDQKITRDWIRAIGVSVGVGLLSTVASGQPFVGALTGLGVGFGWAFFGKSTETAIATVQNAMLKASDEQKVESLRPYFEKNYINDYVLDTEANHKRYRKKLDPEQSKYLRLLNMDEADIAEDDIDPSPPTNDWRDYERLTSAAFRYFGAEFDSSNDNENDGVLVATYPNGLISLVHIDKKERAARHYITYNKAFDVFGEKEAYKHLSPNLTDLPAEGAVHKITHRKGKDFRYTPMSCEEFLGDLSYQLEKNAQDIKAFGLPITTLFNCEVANENIEPKEKNSIPVTQWIASKMGAPASTNQTPLADPKPG
ncbi:MAG: hypothetical protein H6867_03520 [Rhodospirillales bacterium]|nr:hypothetical protein [Rhodospirillales bacterium]MCB9996221.1 hypothetical protein [Rhodospirillales bacterium]